LYETDFNIFADADKVGVPNPNISFDTNVLNLYFDPNTDGEENAVPDTEVDGYQLAFHQFHDPDNGSLISTDADRQGVGFFTEAHHNTPFGDQAHWNRGGVDVEGAAMQDIVVAQRNGDTGGLAEVVFPWANFNADSHVAETVTPGDFDSDGLVDGNDFLTWQRGFGLTDELDSSNGDADFDGDVDVDDLVVWKDAYGTDTQIPTGLNRVDGPVNDEQWYFQVGRQNGEGDVGNFLPVWNWNANQPFAPRPHGTITFQGGPGALSAAAVPEPAAITLAAVAAAGALSARRRRSSSAATN
jgi:hypothetical protein